MTWSKRLFQLLLPLALVAFGLRLFFVQSLFLQTSRLAPVLLRGDFVLGWRQALVNRGDFITFNCMTKRVCVGRVLGLPGDRLDFEPHGKLLVNQAKSSFLLFSDATQLESSSVVVPPETYFVEGDQFGEVLAPQVTSVLSRVLISVDPHQRLFRGQRIWKAIH